MTDTELASLAAAFRGIIEEQGTVFRAQLANLQSRLDDEIAKTVAHRQHEREARERTMRALADAVADAIRPHLAELQRRTGEIEQRSMGAVQ